MIIVKSAPATPRVSRVGASAVTWHFTWHFPQLTTVIAMGGGRWLWADYGAPGLAGRIGPKIRPVVASPSGAIYLLKFLDE
jgi:hypothetical protein